MNLREAILAGARRTNARWTRLSYLHGPLTEDGPFGMCAVTAAYFGCHPDVEPQEGMSPVVRAWADANVPKAWVVMGINDADSSRDKIRVGGWETLCDLLHERRADDGTPLDKVEVCDESA